MRGKPYNVIPSFPTYRITPADAGKTVEIVRHLSVEQDHPRGCGENMSGNCRYTQVTGSPPRMRGKHGVGKWELVRMRITPADAGKTSAVAAVKNLCQDHPRGCGENSE